MKKAINLMLILSIMFLSTSCYTTTHQVGMGGNIEAEGASDSNWYALWGLVTMGQADTKSMTGEATDYTIERETTFLDGFINSLIGWLGFTTDTTTVYYQ